MSCGCKSRSLKDSDDPAASLHFLIRRRCSALPWHTNVSTREVIAFSSSSPSTATLSPSFPLSHVKHAFLFCRETSPTWFSPLESRAFPHTARVPKPVHRRRGRCAVCCAFPSPSRCDSRDPRQCRRAPQVPKV